MENTDEWIRRYNDQLRYNRLQGRLSKVIGESGGEWDAMIQEWATRRNRLTVRYRRQMRGDSVVILS